MASWDRQPGEPSRAYVYFTLYRDLGPGRSLPQVSQTSSVSVPRLKFLSEKYNWVERADQWDAHLQAIQTRALITEAAKQGKRRAKAYSALLEKSETALRNAKTVEVPLKDVAATMKTACEGLRLEEGLATQHLTMEIQDVRTILARFPAEIRTGLVRLFEGDPAARGPAGSLCPVSGETEGDGEEE